MLSNNSGHCLASLVVYLQKKGQWPGFPVHALNLFSAGKHKCIMREVTKVAIINTNWINEMKRLCTHVRSACTCAGYLVLLSLLYQSCLKAIEESIIALYYLLSGIFFISWLPLINPLTLSMAVAEFPHKYVEMSTSDAQ